MENNFYHFSSPTQNNDIILYHQRSKSSLTGSHSSHGKTRVITTDLTKNSQNTTFRSERTLSTELGGGLPRPLQERINVSKSTFENGSTLSKTHSLLLDGENERRPTELEEENKDLKRQLKVRDTKIGLLLKENQEIQDKLDETQHIENRNIQLQSENKCLKSELEALAKRVSELEDEKTKILAGKPYVPKSNDFDDAGHNLMKYTNYLVSYVTRMDKNSFVNFCFSERFSSEKDLLTLITSGEYGAIALQAFRYIIDLLANLHQPSVSTPVQNAPTKTASNMPSKKENKINTTTEQHSIGYESKKTTPRELPRGNSNKNIVISDEPEKNLDWRAKSPFRVSASLEAKNQPRDSVNKISNTKETKPRPGSGMSVRKDSNGSTGQLAKGKRPEQGSVTPTNSSRLNSSMTSTRQGTGTDSRPKQRVGIDKDEQPKIQIGTHLRRLSEGRRGYDSEKGYMLLGGASGVKTRESEHEVSESKRILNKRESFHVLEKRLESRESTGNKYGSVSGSNKKGLDESLGGRGVQDNFLERVNENMSNMNPSMSVRNILEKGIAQEDPKGCGEIEARNTVSRSEKSDIQRIKRPASLISRPAFDPKEKKNDSVETPHEEKKSLQSSRDSTRERPFTHILSNQTLEEDGESSRRRLRLIEVNLELENQENKNLPSTQEVFNRNLTARPTKVIHPGGDEKPVYSTVIPQTQTAERLRDLNSDNFKIHKDKMRLCSMQAPDRPCSVQANVRKSTEKLGERFVTFDGNDNQNLFTCSSDKEEKEAPIANSNRKIEEIEISSIKIGSQRSGSISSEPNIANWIDSNRKKLADQNPHLVDTLNALSLESNRVRDSRGDSNS